MWWDSSEVPVPRAHGGAVVSDVPVIRGHTAAASSLRSLHPIAPLYFMGVS